MGILRDPELQTAWAISQSIHPGRRIMNNLPCGTSYTCHFGLRDSIMPPIAGSTAGVLRAI